MENKERERPCYEFHENDNNDITFSLPKGDQCTFTPDISDEIWLIRERAKIRELLAHEDMIFKNPDLYMDIETLVDMYLDIRNGLMDELKMHILRLTLMSRDYELMEDELEERDSIPSFPDGIGE